MSAKDKAQIKADHLLFYRILDASWYWAETGDAA